MLLLLFYIDDPSPRVGVVFFLSISPSDFGDAAGAGLASSLTSCGTYAAMVALGAQLVDASTVAASCAALSPVASLKKRARAYA